ncbi:rod-binding protein [Microvirga lenta]|uniref:rod-binding protein n=1 Tax=Microvirga lenta TaxID=2881337 RepID=UPI001CFFC039|nr:rod-binding protein [Microvirga lenta]MCB5177737.1 rod-binding protein [Microvirga lenta]
MPTDIVLDVARAADPAKYQAASKRLSELSGPSNAAEFANTFNALTASSRSHVPSDPFALKTALRNDTTLSGADRKDAAYQQFEAFVLQSFIESMMPEESESVFGKGTAGGIWKSMMAEQIGAQIAKAGGIGIAKHVLGARSASEQFVQSNPTTSTGGATRSL